MKKALLFKVMCLIAVLTLSITMAAQMNEGSIEGFVYDKDGKTPLSSAKVLFVNSKSGEKIQVATDASGIYRFAKLGIGDYKVVIIYNGVEYKLDTTVTVLSDKTSTYSFSIKEPKRKAFLATPLGRATLVVGTVAAGYGIYNAFIEPAVSPTTK
jgi:hypothetical protein